MTVFRNIPESEINQPDEWITGQVRARKSLKCTVPASAAEMTLNMVQASLVSAGRVNQYQLSVAPVTDSRAASQMARDHGTLVEIHIDYKY